MKLIITFLLGVICGGVGAWQLKPDLSPLAVEAQALPPSVTTRSSPTTSPAGSSVRPHSRLANPPSVAPAHPPPSAASETTAQPDARQQAQVASLQEKLQTERELRVLDQGEPVPAPPSLDARFQEAALVQSIEKALAQAGFEDASVSSIDCTEYPCIVYGEGMGGREDFERLSETSAFSDYRTDRQQAFGWRMGGKDTPEKRYFGLAMYSRDEAPQRQEALNRRIQYRSRQMQQTIPRP
ncbi:hypothetical protein [Corallococcus macrosporus]|uniref:hypothetical protein n=1 Tax=Corallococcus macrosporus TaxID=35 RepID=UPI000F5135CE|nr:hypothetical protein [Corallococcus macrosporus]